MTRLLLALLLLAVPGVAAAADRRFAVGSFERVRVDGPFEVHVVAGSPLARASGDPAMLDRIVVEVNGDTLVVRLGGEGWGEHPVGKALVPPVVTLSTPLLRSAAINAGARLGIAAMRAPRVDLSVNGSGALDVAAIDADELRVTAIGAAQITLAGKAAHARLLTNGPGTIDAVALSAGELVVRLDGTGSTRATARYTAQVTDTGLGHVTISGNPKCSVSAQAGGPVECGTKL